VGGFGGSADIFRVATVTVFFFCNMSRLFGFQFVDALQQTGYGFAHGVGNFMMI
jgi:hypothetical protein